MEVVSICKVRSGLKLKWSYFNYPLSFSLRNLLKYTSFVSYVHLFSRQTTAGYKQCCLVRVTFLSAGQDELITVVCDCCVIVLQLCICVWGKHI